MFGQNFICIKDQLREHRAKIDMQDFWNRTVNTSSNSFKI